MKNQTNDGILCSFCKGEYKDDFIYYSYDFPNGVSFDACPKCFEQHSTSIIANQSKRKRDTTLCDITGKTGKFKINRCAVAKVEVNLSNSPYCCIKCTDEQNGYVKMIDDKCPKCSGVSAIKIAHVLTDDKFLEFDVHDDVLYEWRKNG